MIRDVKSIEPTSALLVDTSGVSLSDPDEIESLKKSLDKMKIETRAWVINAAYDNSVIDRQLAIAEALAATHTIYTHLDELGNTSRLWHFILSGKLRPLFSSTGPGVAHDRTTQISSILLPKTFPDYLLK
jgi:flagellar biosynthesis protein FlhF